LTALVGWVIALQIRPKLWPGKDEGSFPRPWREVVFVLAATGCCIGLGQLYQRGWRLSGPGPLGPASEAINQFLIFSPFWLLLAFRRHSLRTVWLPTNGVGLRLLIGLALAMVSLLAFTLTKHGSAWWGAVVLRVYDPRNIGNAVQVFCEDMAIAMMMVRLGAALRRPVVAALLVSVMFAAAHLPAMLDGGLTTAQWQQLGLDCGLAFAVLLVVRRSGDIWWFWCVHYAMDMTQFSSRV